MLINFNREKLYDGWGREGLKRILIRKRIDAKLGKIRSDSQDFNDKQIMNVRRQN